MFFYKAFGLSIKSDIELPELSFCDERQFCDVNIILGQIKRPKLKRTGIKRRGIEAKFGQIDDKNLVLHWDGVADYQSIDGHTLIIDRQTDDANLLSLFTVSEAMGLLLFQRGMFLLHASAVLVGDRAWCFFGSPGAGKSTTAAAFVKAGCTLLSDDLTAVTFNEKGDAMVIPAYPQLKIWETAVTGLAFDVNQLSPVSEGVNKFALFPRSTFSHGPVKLENLFFIHKARNIKPLVSLSHAEVLVLFVKNFPLPISLLTGGAIKRHFTQSFKCANVTRVWKKRRDKDFEYLEQWVGESLKGV